MDKKRQRELVKQRKEAEKKRSKTGMSLKLREVDPPDDLEIEMAQLREQAIAQVKAERIDVESGAAEGQLDPTAVELEITRPPFPPAHVTDRLQPAFVGPSLLHLPVFCPNKASSVVPSGTVKSLAALRCIWRYRPAGGERL